MQDVRGPSSEKHAKMLNRATCNSNCKLKHCTVCGLLLSTLYNSSAKEQGNAVPVLAHIS